jgi:hypothetical protein
MFCLSINQRLTNDSTLPCFSWEGSGGWEPEATLSPSHDLCCKHRSVGEWEAGPSHLGAYNLGVSSVFLFLKEICMPDLVIQCRDCQQEFTHSEKDQAFFSKMNFQQPKRCKKCRTFRKAQREKEMDSNA